jgi:hypothetical protein
VGSLSQYTISEPLSIELPKGTVVAGRLWLRPSRQESFEVEYGGKLEHDGRTDYEDIGHMTSIARIILREMAEEATEEADSAKSRK